MKEIIFARHGETEFNKSGRLQGISDSPLTSHGKKQAVKLGLFLRKKDISCFLLSPLQRVIDTYYICNKKTTKPFTVNRKLIEICYGGWETMRKEELKSLPIWNKRNENRFSFIHPGEFKGVKGGSYKQQFGRLQPLFDSLDEHMKKRGKKSIAIISHIGVQRCVKKRYLGLSDREAGNLDIPNNIVLVLSWENNKFGLHEVET